MNKNTFTKLGLILAAGAIPAVNALAGVFVITDDACPAAEGDLEAHLNWETTARTNHSRSFENGIGLEFAYGATETLEVGASLDFGYNYASHHFSRKTAGDNSEHADDFNFTGISLGLKNQILDPENAEKPFGLAFVGGFSWSFAGADSSAAREIGFELGLNFQKNLLDGDLILAFTPGVAFTTSYTYRDEDGNLVSEENRGYEDSIEYSLGFGASYQVAEGLRFGAEGSLNISYSDNFDDTAFYFGPNFCYEAESWWITATLAPRLFSTDPDNRDHDIQFCAQLGFAF